MHSGHRHGHAACQALVIGFDKKPQLIISYLTGDGHYLTSNRDYVVEYLFHRHFISAWVTEKKAKAFAALLSLAQDVRIAALRQGSIISRRMRPEQQRYIK